MINYKEVNKNNIIFTSFYLRKHSEIKRGKTRMVINYKEVNKNKNSEIKFVFLLFVR